MGKPYVVRDATSVYVVEATEKIEVKAGDEMLFDIPKAAPKVAAEAPYFQRDGVSLDHLRKGRKPFDEDCTTCIQMKLRQYQHRRNRDSAEETLGQVSGDLAGPWPLAINMARYLLLLVKRSTRFYGVKALPDKSAAQAKEAMPTWTIDLRPIWCCHTDRRRASTVCSRSGCAMSSSSTRTRAATTRRPTRWRSALSRKSRR